jgi:VanZ family protein
MHRRLYRIFSNRITAQFWTIFIFILLALPGKMLPEENHMAIPFLDKYVHMILFGSFVFLWSFYYAAKPNPENYTHRRFTLILVIACLYGIGMEFIQKYFIPNRDFELYDIAADIAGALVGYILVRFTIHRIRTT